MRWHYTEGHRKFIELDIHKVIDKDENMVYGKTRERYRIWWKVTKDFIPSALFSHWHQIYNSKFCIYSKRYSIDISYYIKYNFLSYFLWLYCLLSSHYFSWKQQFSQGWLHRGSWILLSWLSKNNFSWHFLSTMPP